LAYDKNPSDLIRRREVGMTLKEDSTETSGDWFMVESLRSKLLPPPRLSLNLSRKVPLSLHIERFEEDLYKKKS